MGAGSLLGDKGRILIVTNMKGWRVVTIYSLEPSKRSQRWFSCPRSTDLSIVQAFSMLKANCRPYATHTLAKECPLMQYQ